MIASAGSRRQASCRRSPLPVIEDWPARHVSDTAYQRLGACVQRSRATSPRIPDITILMSKPLLSTYRTGENRVTSSTMAVFERIDLALVEELLRAVTGMGSELQAVSFGRTRSRWATPCRMRESQPGSRGGSRGRP